jgi:hypothetical protein
VSKHLHRETARTSARPSSDAGQAATADGQAAHGRHITDLGHANRDEVDVIMTKIHEMWGQMSA